MLRDFYARLRAVWLLALRERATPAGIAWSVGLGVFVGCTPLIGFHAGAAVVLATVFRLNRLWALIGSRVSFFLALPWIVLAEIQSAHHLRTGRWAPIFSGSVLDHAREWLLDWCFGTFVVGFPLALVLGLLAYALARRRAPLRPRTPSRAPLLSSGSPPSGSSEPPR